MDAIRSNSVSYTGNNIGQTIKDNSTEMTYGGGAGLATVGAFNQSAKVGSRISKVIQTSKNIKADKQAKILSLIEKCAPLAKFAKNPVVKKVAGGLAGLSAATTLVGAGAKIVDTGGYLNSLNTQV